MQLGTDQGVEEPERVAVVYDLILAWLAPTRAAWSAGAPGHQGVLIGIGTATGGIEGFRHSHSQAKRALDLARLARPGRLGPIVRYEQVRLLVLSEDIAVAIS